MAVFPFRTTPAHEAKIRKFAFSATVLILITTVILSLWVKTRIIATGYEVAGLQRQILEEESRLGILEARLYQLGSPGYIQMLAKEHGMVYPAADQLEYLLNQSILRANELADTPR